MILVESDMDQGYSFHLLSKQGQVITVLARELLTSLPGDSIRRVQDYADELDASAGTIHSGLNYLRDIHAVQLEGRGRLGTFVEMLDYPLLWSLAVRRPLIGAMPLPYTLRLEGLATGVRSQFNQQPINLDLRFMRGSTNRLQRLSSRAIDFALVSHFAAETAEVNGFDLQTVFLLGQNTYTSKHVLLLNNPHVVSLQDGMRVGIDVKSADHARVVHAVCRGHRVKFVNIDYSQALKLFHAGVIDATVWTEENLPSEFANLTVVPLESDHHPALLHLSEAAIVIENGNTAVLHVLQKILNPVELVKVQQVIVNLIQLPAY